MARTKLSEVADFLKEFKEIAVLSGVYVIPRRVNNEALIDLGLTKTDRECMIMSLTPVNFCSGPEADRGQSGEVWFFGKTIDGTDIYIKLKIAIIDNDGKIAKCLSFHRAEYNLKYYCFQC